MQVLKSPEQNRESARYITVPVQFSVTLTIEQLKEILYKIETFPRFFMIVQWIRVTTAGAMDPSGIRCDMAVAGIMKNVKE